MLWRLLIGPALLGLTLAGHLASMPTAVAQTPEILIVPLDVDPLPPQLPRPATPQSHLAKCLRNPDDQISCAIAGSAATDGGLESALPGQIKPSAYVTCSDPSGLCLELATLDLGAAVAPPERLAAVDITIEFDFGKATIRAAETRKLNQLAVAMLHPETQGARFVIVGHTDDKGTGTYNCTLSRQRAVAVAERLATLRVPAARLITVGAGFHVPRNRADGRAAENRRVAFAPITEARRNTSRSANQDDNDPILRKLTTLCDR